MSVSLASRISALLMAGFVVLASWGPTLSVPLQAPAPLAPVAAVR